MAACDIEYCVQFVIVVVLVFRRTASVPTSTTTQSTVAVALPPSDWMLVESLATFIVEACDGQSVRLRCPRGTTVGVRSALYGSSPAAACTNSSDATAAAIGTGNGPSSAARLEDDATRLSASANAASGGGGGGGSVVTEPRRHQISGDRDRGERLTSIDDCVGVNSLEVVASLCEEKAQCSVRVASRLFNRPSDCSTMSGQTVYRLSVTYQCRPSSGEARSRPVCPGQMITLSCPRTDLLVLLSAAYVPLTGGPCAAEGPPSSADHGVADNASTQWPQTSEYGMPFRDCGPAEGGVPRVPRKESDGSDETPEMYRWRSAHCPALAAVERCHGRQSCNVFASWCRHQKQTIVDDAGPSSSSSSAAAAAGVPPMTALRVVYACVAPSILRTSDVLSPASMTSFVPTICAVQSSIDVTEGDDKPEVRSSSSTTTQALNETDIIERRSIGRPVTHRRYNDTHWHVDDDWTWTWTYVSLNGEKIVLYASLGALVGLILLLAAVAFRLRDLHARRPGLQPRAFRCATCPCSTAGAFQVPSTRTTAATDMSIGETDDYDGGMAVDVSASRGRTAASGDRTYRSNVEFEEDDRWRIRARDDDRCATAEQCGASCATLIKSRTMTSSSSTSRPILQLDDD